MNIKHILAALALIVLPVQAQVKVAIFALNDFHASFVRNDFKGAAGAPSILQTVDSLKRVYPYHITVSAGDNFGGSYFYNATHGVLLPVFFNDLGIRVSALGNHEFDDGQRALAEKWNGKPLRPNNWDITYVCSNVRSNRTGRIPDFAQPVVSVPITLPGGKVFRTAFVGLIASSTPAQASARKIAGLSFDGNYPAVLDSVMNLPEASLIKDANLHILLTHIGSKMGKNGQVEWNDKDAQHLSEINSPLWHGILSSHSHDLVKGYINQARYPIVQGSWRGDYINMLLCTVDTTDLSILSVEPHTVKVTPKNKLEAEPARLQAQIDSLLQNTRTHGGTPIGEILTQASHNLIHNRKDKYKQSEVGTLVCQSYAEAYRQAAHEKDETVIIGCSHIGGIRSGITKGPVSVLDVGEALPFANALKAYSLTGKQLTELVEFGLHNQMYGWLQTGNLNVEQDENTHVTKLIYTSPQGKRKILKNKKKYVLVTDDFITTGGDGYNPNFFPAKQSINIKGMPLTTDAFINYLRQQKEI